MLLWSENTSILYLKNIPFEISDSLKIQPAFIVNGAGTNHYDVSIVICNKEEALTFFVVCHSEEDIEINQRNGVNYHNKVFKYFFKQYYQTYDKIFISRFIADINLKENISTFMKLSETPQLLKYELKPFGTIVHTEASRIYIQNFFSIHLINHLEKNKIELKSANQIIFSDEFIQDESKEYLIKKGIEFFFESFGDKNYLVLNYTNFLRSAKSIDKLGLKEPIDYTTHKFINILDGKRLKKKFTFLKNIEHPEHFHESFTNTDIYDAKIGKVRFSQKAFYFEQTNLSKTIQLISKFKSYIKTPLKNLDFSSLNNIDWNYRIIKRNKKFVFGEGELHFTSSKGLFHSGVLQAPKDLKLQLLISKKGVESKGKVAILHEINEAIEFLYKGVVSKIEEDDLLIYDYNNFDSSFSKSLNRKKSVITYIIDPNKSSYNLTIEQKEKLDSINFQIIKTLRKYSDSYVVVGEIDIYVFANAILKISLKKGAVPWKIDSIDPNDSSHIFIGIDLGHDHKTRHTNLTITAVNNHGCFIDSAQVEGIEINEMIPLNIISDLFREIFKKIGNKQQLIKNITVHRDGRFFENIADFEKAIKTAYYGNSELVINLVEVVKSDVPLIGFTSNDTYIDAFEGLYFFVCDTAYLVTNDQSLNTGTAPKPLKIRKISGYKSIEQLTEEVFWLTKPYSINLFLPSKLPLTTLLANNLSYTGSIVHFITV